MQLPGEFFNGGNDTRSRAIDGIADYGVAAIAHRIEDAPSGTSGESVEIARGSFGVRGSEDQIIRLKAHDLFEAHLRPILRRFDDGGCACFAENVGDKGMLAGGNERFGPNDEENTPRRNGGEVRLQRSEAPL